ncbi:MAG: lytic murein transglycosylase B [Burkholderiales bacterium]
MFRVGAGDNGRQRIGAGWSEAELMLLRALLACWVLGMGMTFTSRAQAPDSIQLKPEVEAFVTKMVVQHRFREDYLRGIFSQLRSHEGVVKAIGAPSTAKPWHEFRKTFVTPTRTTGGVSFWTENADALKRARDIYGIPEEVIVSIIGVETIYGRRTGGFRVIEAIYTLAFEMTERAEFFRSEMEQYLLLTRENGFDPLEVKGSFAGALGVPQFIPSSYRRYAVDFDGDGKIDLWNSNTDAIGSVANFLNHFGWVSGQTITTLARVNDANVQEVLDAGFKPNWTVEQMQAKGVEPMENIGPETQAGLFALDSGRGPEYWLALNNLYVITRYNRSRNYAMAVFQLAQAIAREKAGLPPLQAGSVATQ